MTFFIFLPAALAAWSWDGLECCCSLGTFSFWYEFSNLGPALFLYMANLKTLSEIVRFTKSSRFPEIFWFLEFLTFSGFSAFHKLSDFQNYLVC